MSAADRLGESAILAFTAGWGWTGLLLATARRLVSACGETAGHTVQVGVVAPYIFGALTNTLGFTTPPSLPPQPH